MNARSMVLAGAILGGLAVGAGAFGAHGLRDRLDAHHLDLYETAVRYQMYHALALLGAAWLAERAGRKPAGIAGRAFVFGAIVFCGTVYGLALGGPRWLGAITPIGGVALIAGWIALALSTKGWRDADGA